MTMDNIFGENRLHREDFIGFTFNGRHSSDMNVIRVSGGNRYEVTLHSQLKHTTVDISGSDGEVVTSTKRQKKTLPAINIAYDNLSESDMRAIKEWLSPKTACPLVYDEEPYKTWYVTISGTPNLKFICFDKDNDPKGERVYKGEGTIQFEAAYPYAICEKKYLSDYADWTDVNLHQWAGASGLQAAPGTYDIFNGNTAPILNCGSRETDMKMVVTGDGVVKFTRDDGAFFYIDFEKLNGNSMSSTHFMIDSELKLLIGGTHNGTEFIPNGKIYNFAIIAGEIFNIKKDTQSITYTGSVFFHKLNGVDVSYNFIYY